MDSHQHLLAEYQQILQLSERMLLLAERGQWDELVELELVYLNAVESSTKASLSADLSLALQEALHQRLRQILENETELKRLLQLRLNELRELVERSSRQQALNNTYGQFSRSEPTANDPQ